MPSFRLADATLVAAPGAPFLEVLAVRELQRYLTLLTGSHRPIATSAPAEGPLVLVGAAARDDVPDALAEQEIVLRTVTRDGQTALAIVGGSPAATQWAAYAFLEQVGCGFYLGGDALPARAPDLAAPDLDLRRAPAFAVRGTLPWYNFLNGPTAWNPGDHRRFYDQLAKQGANFVGYHSYDWEPWAAYPGGGTGALMGQPAATSGSNHYRDIWGPVPTATSDYAFGTDRLFAHGLFGADCAFGYATHADGIWRQQAMLAEALGYARARGIRTCLGFEVSGAPDAMENVDGLHARLDHVLRTYPLDYVWLWQEEGRGGGLEQLAPGGQGTNDELATHFAYLEEPWRIAEAVRVCHYVRLAHRLMQELAPRVRLIVSGWGGDHWMAFTDFYRGLDRTVPDDIIFSALDNIDPTFEPNVSRVYGDLKPGRERWPIPWFESDGGGTRRDQWGPQPNVHAFAPLLDDAQGKRCQGIVGIHWRTRAVEEVAGYTFRRAWEPDLTSAAYLDRLARACYGPSLGGELAALHRRLEEWGPRWTGAMGQIECGPFAWFSREGHALPPPETYPPYRNGYLPAEGRAGELAEIEARLSRLCTSVRSSAETAGQATLERLTYLLGTLRWLLRYDRAALLLWPDSPIEAALRRGEQAWEESDEATARTCGREALELLASSGFGTAVQTLADTVTNQGELGVLAAVNGKAVAAYKGLITRAEGLAGARKPDLVAADAWPSALRLWAWPPGDAVAAGRPLALQVRALGPRPLRSVAIHYQPLDASIERGWEVAECLPERGAVYRGAIPASALVAAGLRYYVSATDDDGATATAPLTAPAALFTATVVIAPGNGASSLR